MTLNEGASFVVSNKPDYTTSEDCDIYTLKAKHPCGSPSATFIVSIF